MRRKEQEKSSASVAEVYELYIVPAACGTGIVARTAAQQAGATGVVVGLDLHGGMLAVSRAQEPTGVCPRAYHVRMLWAP